MGEVNEQTIVISDILSFLSCKINLLSKEKLLRLLGDFYSEKDINEGHKTLLSSLPVKKSTRHGRRVKNPDPLIAMYDCFQLIPNEDLPTFVCKNINNVPDAITVKSEPNDSFENDESIEEEEDGGDISPSLMEEHLKLKSQISDISSFITKLKFDMEKFTKKSLQEGIDPISKPRLGKNDKNVDGEGNSSNQKKAGLAFLQSLIDEDGVKNDDAEEVSC